MLFCRPAPSCPRFSGRSRQSTGEDSHAFRDRGSKASRFEGSEHAAPTRTVLKAEGFSDLGNAVK